MHWQIQEAKQRFSELVRRAEADGPQVVTRHSKEAVFVVSAQDFHRMRGAVSGFKEFLAGGPDFEPLDIRRADDVARRVDLTGDLGRDP